jgi:beta-lactamase regulating signal transducer with metallopeptidase domain
MLDRLAPPLLDLGLRSVVVLGAAGMAVLLMRRASAAARHWVWLLGFAGLLLLPVVSTALPAWYVLPHFTERKPLSQVVQVPPAEISPESPVSGEVTPIENALPVGKVESSSRSASQAALPVTTVQPTSNQIATSRTPAPIRLSRLNWLVLGWIFGTVLVFGHVLLGYLSLWSLRRHCSRVESGELRELVNRLCVQSGIRREVELLSSDARTMPMTWGLLRARLLLPREAAAWSPEQKRAVLLHELGHVKRWDCLAQLLVQLACAIYWINPIAWIAARRMQVERERACDDRVLSSGADASSYARHLLDCISAVPPFRLLVPAAAMGRPSTLEERVRAILDGRRNRRSLTTRGGIATALLLLAALAPVALVKAQQADTQQPPANIRSPATPTTRPAGSPDGRSGSRSVPRRFGNMPIPTPGQGPTCDFDATIYDVRMPADQIGRLDIHALEKAAGSAESFEKALAGLGSVKPLYRADQSVRLSGENVAIETQTPIVTSVTTTVNGHTVSSYSYYSVGALFSVAGSATSSGALDLDLGIQLSTVADSAVNIYDKVKAATIRSATITHKGPVEPRKPFVVVSVDANTADASGKAVAYIARITVGEPQPTAGPGEGH